MKIAVVSAVWKRPEVFEMFAKGLLNLKASIEHELIIIIAGSEGNKSKTMVEKYGFTYIEVPNSPLATKHNATTLEAKKHNPDYVLFLGSDDIIGNSLMSVYDRYMERSVDFIGVTDFYFYDITTKKSSYWGGYTDNRIGHTAGAGRLISKRLMNLWNWETFEVKDSHVLDNSVQNKLRNLKYSSALINMKAHDVFALDIKSSENMTPFDLWPNTKLIDTKIIQKEFKYIF